MEFQEWGKIPRLSRDCTITEKIDGTNAQVLILQSELVSENDPHVLRVVDGFCVFAGSRTRWVTPTEDNHGWAKWVLQHVEELIKLGPGHHYGEWWGSGIQRGYGLKEKKFSLFNTHKWSDPMKRPACCDVVPTLYVGPFETSEAIYAIDHLRQNGSVAAPGFMKPEGIIIYHHAAGSYFKKTLEKDDKPKGSQE